MSVPIIKRKLRKFPEEILPLREKGKHLTYIGADEFISETYEFLKAFYKGCYDAYLTRVGFKNLFICIENFATVLRGLVKAVFGRELIIIRFIGDFETLRIDLEFDTSVVSNELREEMKSLATSGGFSISFSERLARLEFNYIMGAVPYVNSNSTRIVYNTILSTFKRKNF